MVQILVVSAIEALFVTNRVFSNPKKLSFWYFLADAGKLIAANLAIGESRSTSFLLLYLSTDSLSINNLIAFSKSMAFSGLS